MNTSETTVEPHTLSMYLHNEQVEGVTLSQSILFTLTEHYIYAWEETSTKLLFILELPSLLDTSNENTPKESLKSTETKETLNNSTTTKNNSTINKNKNSLEKDKRKDTCSIKDIRKSQMIQKSNEWEEMFLRAFIEEVSIIYLFGHKTRVSITKEYSLHCHRQKRFIPYAHTKYASFSVTDNNLLVAHSFSSLSTVSLCQVPAEYISCTKLKWIDSYLYIGCESGHILKLTLPETLLTSLSIPSNISNTGNTTGYSSTDTPNRYIDIPGVDREDISLKCIEYSHRYSSPVLDFSIGAYSLVVSFFDRPLHIEDSKGERVIPPTRTQILQVEYKDSLFIALSSKSILVFSEALNILFKQKESAVLFLKEPFIFLAHSSGGLSKVLFSCLL
ncbi:hypothetical protein NEOKW01_1038 [Nematocida sp. AWRm80]|nr:hypothetical protein NEOKW01_1038 [Nematocida sp. AWRm80]